MSAPGRRRARWLVPAPVRPLRHRDFPLLWTGLLASMIGSGLWLAAFGFGGAFGALAISSRRLPRRYLTVMLLLWGFGTLPLAAVGLATQLWMIGAALFVVGAAFSAGVVIWGTLLQRRVPDGLRGRVSSLDFFISLALMPLSMAIAGPLGAAFGVATIFLVAGVAPGFLAVAAILGPRLDRDEILHPLDEASTGGAVEPVNPLGDAAPEPVTPRPS